MRLRTASAAARSVRSSRNWKISTKLNRLGETDGAPSAAYSVPKSMLSNKEPI
jgi:hypothetical protein